MRFGRASSVLVFTAVVYSGADWVGTPAAAPLDGTVEPQPFGSKSRFHSLRATVAHVAVYAEFSDGTW